MHQEPLPQEYINLSQEEIDARTIKAKQTLGKRLVILGHHYQRDEIIAHADFRGDSYKLATLENSFAQMDGIGGVLLLPFGILAHVHEHGFRIEGEPRARFRHADFGDESFGVVDEV